MMVGGYLCDYKDLVCSENTSLGRIARSVCSAFTPAKKLLLKLGQWLE